jgi:hypothetical protein
MGSQKMLRIKNMQLEFLRRGSKKEKVNNGPHNIRNKDKN